MAEIDGIDLKILRSRFYEYIDGTDEQRPGDEFNQNQMPYETDEFVLEDLTLGEAIDRIRTEGVTFESTGQGDWAELPDSVHVIHYATGACESVSVFVHNADRLPGFVLDAIVAGTDSKETLSANQRRRLNV